MNWDLFRKIPNLGGINSCPNGPISSLTGISALAKYCPQLSSIQLEGCGLSQIPSEISSLSALPALQVLDFSWNKLSSLPDSIFDLVNLPILLVNNNLISRLSSAIARMQALNHFDISKNNLTSLNSNTNWSSITSLSFIDLSGNQLQGLPESFYNMSNLATLNVGNNQISFLSESIAQMERLAHLVVNYNKLTSLPNSISLLPLIYLDISFNQIAVVPRLFPVVEAMTLYLQNNLLKSIDFITSGV